MHWYKKLGLTVVAGMLTLGATSAQAIESQQWRFALEEIEGSVQYNYASMFAEKIKEKTDGAVSIQIFPYGEIGGLTDIYDAVQGGAVQLAFGSGFLGGTVPESQLFSLNFILSDDQWVNAQALNSDEFIESDAFQNSFLDRGLKPLSVVIEGWQVWSANKEIRTPEDFDGVAIRTMDNRLLTETYEAYGASPLSIEYGELYSALQLGQADAAIQPLFAHEEMGFYEVQSHLIFANQAEFIATAMANASWYEGLSDELKGIIQETADELVRPTHEMQVELNDKRMDSMMEAKPDLKTVELTKEERAAFRERSMPVRDTFVEMVGERGQTLLDLTLDVVEKQEQDM